MAEKTRITTCSSCGRPRKAGGKTKLGVCRLCRHQAVLAMAPEKRKRGPYQKRVERPRGWALSVRARPNHPTPQWVSQHVKDKRAMHPTSSWWIVPRSHWSRAIAEQMPRLQAIGAEVPRTQMGVADAS